MERKSALDATPARLSSLAKRREAVIERVRSNSVETLEQSRHSDWSLASFGEMFTSAYANVARAILARFESFEDHRAEGRIVAKGGKAPESELSIDAVVAADSERPAS